MIRLGNVKLILGKEQVSGGKSYEEEKEISCILDILSLKVRVASG